MAHLVDLVVDGGVLLDVGVGRGDVGLGLVVVVVGDEVLDGVVGEELLELAVELGRQGLVVGEDQGRPAAAAAMTLAMVKVLPRAGDAEQDLVAVAARRGPSTSSLDGPGLVAGGGEVALEIKGRGGNIPGPDGLPRPLPGATPGGPGR